MQLIEHSKDTAGIIYKEIGLQSETSQQLTFSETKFQTNLQYIEKNLIQSLMELKLQYNQFLFIDGIDIRPNGIEYKEYLSCVKGLAEAVWSLNNDQFAISNDSKGRFKVVILLRPDIFQSIGLQNSTNKIINNSVFLDWRTTYNDYKNSELYKIAQKLLTYNQDKEAKEKSMDEIWDYYFQWAKPSTNPEREYDIPFIEFLRISCSRPRDIVTIVQYLKKHKNKNILTNYISLVYHLIAMNLEMHIRNI